MVAYLCVKMTQFACSLDEMLTNEQTVKMCFVKWYRANRVK